MGCSFSQSKVTEDTGLHRQSKELARKSKEFAKLPKAPHSRPKHVRERSGVAAEYLSAPELLRLCQAAVRLQFRDKLDPLLLAAVAMIESGGDRNAWRYTKTDSQGVRLEEERIGLCQMQLSTAKTLVRERGFDLYDVPTSTELQDPAESLYFGAAYLVCLSTHGGQPQDEEFMVRSYHMGPEQADSKQAGQFWKHVKAAKEQLKQIQERGDKAGTLHVVRPADSLPRIALQHNVTVDDIAAANPGIAGSASLQLGQCIRVPPATLDIDQSIHHSGHGLQKIDLTTISEGSNSNWQQHFDDNYRGIHLNGQ